MEFHPRLLDLTLFYLVRCFQKIFVNKIQPADVEIHITAFSATKKNNHEYIISKYSQFIAVNLLRYLHNTLVSLREKKL